MSSSSVCSCCTPCCSSLRGWFSLNFYLIRLTNEIDYDGRICGYDHGVKDRPNGYYLSTGAVVCVKYCPAKTDYYSFVCMDDDQDDADASYVDGWKLVGKGRCMYNIKTQECSHCFHYFTSVLVHLPYSVLISFLLLSFLFQI